MENEKMLFIEELKKGFENNKLAKVLGCSATLISDLKLKPIENEIYHAKDINFNAIYEYAKTKNIDFTTINFDDIRKEKRFDIAIVVVDTVLPNGETVVNILHCQNKKLIVTNTRIYSQTEIKKMYLKK